MIHFDIAHDLPDAGGGVCCEGAAAFGAGRCTCWEPVYDCEQQPVCAGPMHVRSEMCRDCAFRPDSPERRGDARYSHAEEGDLDELLLAEFACHQGMRRKLKMRHPSGFEVAIEIDAYAPPDWFRPQKADGSPADLCAGWWLMKQKLMA